jgi:hypothetical protein
MLGYALTRKAELLLQVAELEGAQQAIKDAAEVLSSVLD